MDEEEVKKAIDDATAPFKISIEKLEAKNAELKAEKRKAQDNATDADTRANDAERKLEQLGHELEDLKGGNNPKDDKTGDVDVRVERLRERHAKEIGRFIEDHGKAMAEVQENLKATAGINRKLLVDRGLREQLTTGEHKVSVETVNAVIALIKAENEIDIDGEDVMIADEKLSVFVESFKRSDTGKHFISAPLNGGGGGGGGSNVKGGTVANPWKSDTRNLTEQGRITKEDPELAAKLRSDAGIQ